jgi:hypothetical protein
MTSTRADCNVVRRAVYITDVFLIEGTRQPAQMKVTVRTSKRFHKRFLQGKNVPFVKISICRNEKLTAKRKL